MNRYYFADAGTGVFFGDWLQSLTPEAAIRSARPGTVAVAGVTDWLRQRLDITTGELVPHEPIPPSGDHVLVLDRWVLKPEVQLAQQQRAEALAEIRRLELEVQPRCQRELLLDPTNHQARGRLAAIEQRIAELRGALTAAS